MSWGLATVNSVNDIKGLGFAAGVIIPGFTFEANAAGSLSDLGFTVPAPS